MEHRHSGHPVGGQQLNPPNAEHTGPNAGHPGHQPHGMPDAGMAQTLDDEHTHQPEWSAMRDNAVPLGGS